jgi:hypothetical protein
MWFAATFVSSRNKQNMTQSNTVETIFAANQIAEAVL